jgi:Carboxypeptidase regulatory-like domain
MSTFACCRRLFECLLLSLGVLALTSLLFGQGGTSDVVGHVKDKSGAVVNGATITVINKASGLQRSASSSIDGGFTIAGLPPGLYQVEVSQSGFGKQTRDLAVLVGQSPELNVTLLPATETVSVNVQEELPLVETSGAVVHKTITPEQVDSLPIDGRDFSTLAALVPGVTTGNTAIDKNYDPVKRNVPAISINGQNGRNLFMAIDGGDNTDIFMGGSNITLSLEAVQEFEVITHDPKANYGRGIGGVVNVVTKAGTNNWHGSGFGFFRDSAFASIDAISAQAHKPKPPTSGQQFGGTIGGPLVHDRFFFFYSYERQRKNQQRVFNSTSTNPAVAALNGTTTPQAFRQNFNDGRLDLRVNNNNNFFIRYAEQDNNSSNEFFSDLDAPNSAASETNKLHDVVAAWTSVLSPNKVNDARFHWQFFSNLINNNVSSLNTPTIILGSGVTFGASQAGTQAPKEITYQFSDDFTYTKGRHTLRMGANFVIQPHIGIFGDFRHNRYRFNNDDYDPATNTIGATNSLANYRSWSSPAFDIVNKTLAHSGFYFMDEIRLRRLSITAGLRYDFVHNLIYNRGTLAEQIVRDNIGQFPGSPHNRVPQDDKAEFAPRLSAAYDVFGNGKAVIHAGWARLFDPSSILASTLFADLEVPQINGNPPFNFVFVPGAFAGFFGLPCSTTPCQPAAFDASTIPFSFPIGFVNSSDMKVARADQFNLGGTYQVQDGPLAGMTFGLDGIYSRTRRLTQGRNANFCVNKGNLAAYQSCLNGSFDPNGVNFPQAGPNDPITNIPRQIYLQDTTGRNDYTAAMFSVQRRFSRLNLLAHYTVSRAITDTNQFTFIVLNQLNPHAPGELGPSEFDEHHRGVIAATVTLPWGMQYSTILQAATARPYTPTSAFNGGDVNGDGVPTVFGAITNGPGGSRTFQTENDRVGPRGSLRGDPTFSWDMRFAKIFSLESLFKRDAKIELLAEVFNITNKANYGQNYQDLEFLGTPGPVPTPNPTFRQPINIISPPRTAQFGFRFTF